MLAMEGLIRIDPWKGAVVQSFNALETFETFQCRNALEMLAMKIFLSEPREKQVVQLENLIMQAEASKEISEFVEISSNIHDIWVEGCGNSRLLFLLIQLNTVLLRERNLSANSEDRKVAIIIEHKRILKAVQERDVEKACEALSIHLSNGYEYSIISQKNT